MTITAAVMRREMWFTGSNKTVLFIANFLFCHHLDSFAPLPSRFRYPRGCAVHLVVPNSSIVISRSNLQDRPHENHEKYRHAFARGLPDHRRTFRVRLATWTSHLPTLSCSPCRRHLYSHWQMRKECRVTSGEEV